MAVKHHHQLFVLHSTVYKLQFYTKHDKCSALGTATSLPLHHCPKSGGMDEGQPNPSILYTFPSRPSRFDLAQFMAPQNSLYHCFAPGFGIRGRHPNGRTYLCHLPQCVTGRYRKNDLQSRLSHHVHSPMAAIFIDMSSVSG